MFFMHIIAVLLLLLHILAYSCILLLVVTILFNKGKSSTEKSNLLSMSRRTVNRIVRRYKDLGTPKAVQEAGTQRLLAHLPVKQSCSSGLTESQNDQCSK